jgi:hypothetical protein
MSPATSSLALPGLAVLEQTPIILEKLVHIASDDQLQWKPSMERWSISEVLAHLAEAEALAFRDRVKMMLDHESPLLEAYDQNAAYTAGRYSGARARENLKIFCHERDRTLSWLRYIPAGMSSRTGRHAEYGPITVGQLMNEWAFHDLGHIRQITELYRSRAFWPAMGAFQKTYKINP